MRKFDRYFWIIHHRLLFIKNRLGAVSRIVFIRYVLESKLSPKPRKRVWYICNHLWIDVSIYRIIYVRVHVYLFTLS